MQQFLTDISYSTVTRKLVTVKTKIFYCICFKTVIVKTLMLHLKLSSNVLIYFFVEKILFISTTSNNSRIISYLAQSGPKLNSKVKTLMDQSTSRNIEYGLFIQKDWFTLIFCRLCHRTRFKKLIYEPIQAQFSNL